MNRGIVDFRHGDARRQNRFYDSAFASACAVDQNFSGAFRRRDRYAFAGDNPVYLCRFFLNVDYDFVFDVYVSESLFKYHA